MDTESRSIVSFEVAPGEYTPSLKALFRIVWQRFWIIALMAVLFTGASVGFGLLQPPVYEAHVDILVNREPGSATGGNIQTDINGIQGLTKTVVEAVDSRRVAEAVMRELDLPGTQSTVLNNMSVYEVPDTQFVQIYYTDTDPKRAADVANAIANVTSEQISEVSPRENAITATVWERAVQPDAPASPRLIRNAILALIIGIFVGGGLAFLLEYLDDSWRSPEEVELISGVPMFGAIPEFAGSKIWHRAERRGGR